MKEKGIVNRKIVENNGFHLETFPHGEPRACAPLTLYSNLLSPQKHINSDWVRAWITIMLSTEKVRIRGNRNILPQRAIKVGT